MLTENQARNLLARLYELQRTNEAQRQCIESLHRENVELREANEQLLRKVTEAFPFGWGPVRLGKKRIASIGRIKDGVIEHVMPVLPLGGGE